MSNETPKDILASWQAPEYTSGEKSSTWYFGLFGLAVLLIVWSIFTKNYLFTLIIAMGAVVIYMLSQRKPEMMDIAITPDGVKINDRLYSYDDDLVKFWIIYKPHEEVKILNFDQRGIRPNLAIQLEDQNPLRVREILLKYLEEDVSREEGSIDRLARTLGL